MTDDLIDPSIIHREICTIHIKRSMEMEENTYSNTHKKEFRITIYDPKKITREVDELVAKDANERYCLSLERGEPKREEYSLSWCEQSDYMNLFVRGTTRKRLYLKELDSYIGKHIIQGCVYGLWNDASPDSVTPEFTKEQDRPCHPTLEEHSYKTFGDWVITNMQWFGAWYEGPDINEQACEKDEVLCCFIIEGRHPSKEHFWSKWQAPDFTFEDWEVIEKYVQEIFNNFKEETACGCFN